MAPELLVRRLGPDRAAAASLAVGSLAACAALAAVDPESTGVIPACPTRAVLGFDCPACGTLRGLHDLGRFDVLSALDHNLLLAVAVPLGALVWWRWARTAMGHPPSALRWPRWLPVVSIAVALGFTIVRNLATGDLAWLAAT